MRSVIFSIVLMTTGLTACAPSYHIAADDLAKLRAGVPVYELRDDKNRAVNLDHEVFDFRRLGRVEHDYIFGLDQLNLAVERRALAEVVELNVRSQPNDYLWQRLLLGGSVGFVIASAVGFTVGDRIVLERRAVDGSACNQCSDGTVALSTLVGAALGIIVGTTVAYFINDVSSTRDGLLQFVGNKDPLNMPASSSAPATLPGL